MTFPDCNTRITKRWGCLLLAVLCSGAFPLRTIAEVRIEAVADPTDLYLGEAVTLSVQVSGFSEGMEPDLSALPGAVTLLGHRDESRQSITIVNGRRQVTGFSGRLFQYRVIPTAAGTQRLGPVRVTAGGKAIASTSGPAINVRPVPQQDTVLLLLDSTKRQVIIDETFTITLRILVRRLKPPYANESPLPAQAPPFLSIPYLDQDKDDGIECEDIHERLNAILINSGNGFRINNFTANSGDPFGGMFDNGRQALFRFDRQEVMHNGAPYYEYRFPVAFTPRREGTFTFGPVVFKGPVFINVTPAGEGQTETIYAIAEPIAVRATPPPLANRPDTYIGAIGSNLAISASLDAQTCYIGDPLTLTVEIRGDGRLDTITAPRLCAQPELQRDFRIYEDTVQRESGEDYRRYRFTIRPSRAGTLEFPPVAVAYYDTTRNDYRTVYSEPLPVRVNAVTEMQRDMIIDTGTQSITIRGADDPLAPAPVDMTGSLTATTPFFTPRLHLPLLLAGPLCYLAVLALRLRRRMAPALSVNRRRQRAAANAIRQLRQTDAASALPGPVLHDYLDSRLGPSFKAATPPECEQLLLGNGIAPGLARRFASGLEACTLAAFAHPAPTETANDDLRREAENLITELEKSLRKPPRRRASRQAPALAILLALPLAATRPCDGSPADRPGNRSEDFEAQRASTFLLAATQPEDFAKAAEALATLVDDGAANAALFYNYGTVLLLAGDADAALEALARAERYSGTTWAIRRNMRLARRAQESDAPAASLPWQRIPLFWHYRLPVATRMTVAACAFSAIWLLAIWRRSRHRELVLAAIWIACAVCLLFGASVLTSLHAEVEASLNHARRQSTAPPPESQVQTSLKPFFRCNARLTTGSPSIWQIKRDAMPHGGRASSRAATLPALILACRRATRRPEEKL